MVAFLGKTISLLTDSNRAKKHYLLYDDRGRIFDDIIQVLPILIKYVYMWVMLLESDLYDDIGASNLIGLIYFMITECMG